MPKKKIIKKSKDSGVFVVVPTIREHSIARFLKEWQAIFKKHQVHLIIVEDNPTWTFNIKGLVKGYKVSHYSWADIEKDLRKNAWIIPRRSSAIKAYGFFKAYEAGAKTIITLDDDCYPTSNYELPSEFLYDPIRKHRDNLDSKKFEEAGWTSSIKNIRPRGLPYEGVHRDISDKVILSHGLWANIPDVDGKTQLEMKEFPHVNTYFTDQVIPRGSFFPMCGMNLAWKRELTPAMYFMLMGKDAKGVHWGFDRFDDIWAGIFAKKIIDTLDMRAVSGHPVIWHDRASDPQVNFDKEKTGLPVNEKLWRAVDAMELTSKDIKSMYKEMAKKLPFKDKYWTKKKQAMQIWADLF